jgi:hypothetical protein
MNGGNAGIDEGGALRHGRSIRDWMSAIVHDARKPSSAFCTNFTQKKDLGTATRRHQAPGCVKSISPVVARDEMRLIPPPDQINMPPHDLSPDFAGGGLIADKGSIASTPKAEGAIAHRGIFPPPEGRTLRPGLFLCMGAPINAACWRAPHLD